MFNLENISKTYAKAHTKAVSDLTLTINNGEIFGFLGPNGAGKTYNPCDDEMTAKTSSIAHRE